MVSVTRPVTGPGPDPQAVAAWLEASCSRSGLTVQVTDPLALRRIGALLGADPGERPPRAERAARPRGRALQPPDGLDPVGVQPGTPHVSGGLDDDVIDHGPDNGGLPTEVEAVPPGS